MSEKKKEKALARAEIHRDAEEVLQGISPWASLASGGFVAWKVAAAAWLTMSAPMAIGVGILAGMGAAGASKTMLAVGEHFEKRARRKAVQKYLSLGGEVGKRLLE